VTGLIFAVSAAALGGLDSLGGAIVGGLAIGLVQSIAVPYLRRPNELSLGAAVVVLMLVLLFKPSGLFGTPQVERV
jgi:branched-chain amino acid transport system permease protein